MRGACRGGRNRRSPDRCGGHGFVPGLGTVPSLVAVGIAGHAAGRTFHRGVTAFAPAVLLVNAAVLGVLGAGRAAVDAGVIGG